MAEHLTYSERRQKLIEQYEDAAESAASAVEKINCEIAELEYTLAEKRADKKRAESALADAQALAAEHRSRGVHVPSPVVVR